MANCLAQSNNVTQRVKHKCGHRVTTVAVCSLSGATLRLTRPGFGACESVPVAMEAGLCLWRNVPGSSTIMRCQ